MIKINNKLKIRYKKLYKIIFTYNFTLKKIGNRNM